MEITITSKELLMFKAIEEKIHALLRMLVYNSH